MTANEQFEYMAELFYKETGFMAPGRDSPAAFGGVSSQVRQDKWDEWAPKFYCEMFELHKSNTNCVENS